jgi:hypothetical protein
MQRSNLMPFFWAKLAAPALLIGALGSACSAGSVDDAPNFSDTSSTPTTTTPAPNAQNPRPAPAATPASTGSTAAAPTASTPPGSNAASGSAANGAAANGSGNEALPTPELDPGAAPEEQDEDDANAGGGNQNAADDDEDEGDDEIDDDGGDDDGDDDDGDDGDDEDEGDDDDGDDDSGVGATPAPTPPPVNPSPDAVTFTADIRPILLDNCGRCHATGGLPRFASNDAASSFDVAFSERNSIVSEIQRGNMPADTCNGAPGSNGCVSVADFDLIRQWVAAGAPE